mgnify:CR=1 FL=1
MGCPRCGGLDPAFRGFSTTLKPAFEPVVVARKPLVGTVAGNVLAWGTGALNVDGCRIAVDPDDPVNTAVWTSRPSTIRPGTQGFITSHADGERSAPRPPGLGRWPANLIHDGSEECTGLLGEAARFFYVPKTSKADREDGCGALPSVAHQSGMGGAMPVDDDGNDRDRFTAQSRNHHPTVKPTDLMRYLCRLVTPPGGLVLDPFTGSGSTGRGAVLEGFRFLGIEREAEYVEIARRRCSVIADAPVEYDLFGNVIERRP